MYGAAGPAGGPDTELGIMSGLILLLVFLVAFLAILYWGISHGNDHGPG